VDVGIARTQPRYDGQEEVREVERLFLDSIDAAERSIFIENQFLTCTKVAARLAQRMRQRPNLEALLIAPQHHQSWLEAHTMRNGRIRFRRVLEEAGVADRVRIVYPHVEGPEGSTDTMVHSKVMIIDDRFLRIGSANLNNRSMGTDTECDLAVEAKGEEERRAIVDIRDRLIADHCGVTAEVAAGAVVGTGSLIKAADQLTCNGHCLRPVEDGEPDPEELVQYVESVADPEAPIAADSFLEAVFGNGHRGRGPFVKVAAAVAFFAALVLAWRFTPLEQWTEPDTVRASLASLAENRWAPLLMIATFVAAGLVAFPVTILIAATAAAFGPWAGLLYAATGVLASAIVTYALGARLGKDALRSVLGPRLNRLRRRIARRGVIAVATIRLVPLAPFTVVNLVAGASAIRPVDYIAGTILGMLPGLIVLSILGHQVMRILSNPTWTEVGLLVAAVAAWIGASIGLQAAVTKLGSERP
jgi:phospholipase D1/2